MSRGRTEPSYGTGEQKGTVEQKRSHPEAVQITNESCRSAQVDTSSYRKQFAGGSQAVPLAESTHAASHRVSRYQVTNLVPTEPLDTAKAIDIGNGVQALIHKNGSVSVTIPLPKGGNSQVDYAWTHLDKGAPRQSLGHSNNLDSRGAEGDPLVLHKLADGATSRLQVTLSGPATRGQLWIDGTLYNLDPATIKAEVAKSRVTLAPSEPPSSSPSLAPRVTFVSTTIATPEPTEAPSPTPEESIPPKPEPDPRLQKIRDKLTLAISQLTGVGSGVFGAPTRAADIKEVLETTRKTIDKVENKLFETRDELAARWADAKSSPEQKEAYAKQISEIDQALSQGLYAAAKDVGAQKPDDIGKFDATRFFKRFDSLLTLPAPATPPTPGGATPLPSALTSGASLGDRAPSAALADTLAVAEQYKKLLDRTPYQPLDAGRDHLNRVITEARTVEARLLGERKALLAEKPTSEAGKTAQIDERIKVIDSLLDRELPKFLKRELYKENGTLKDLAILDRVSIHSHFASRLTALVTAPSIEGAQIFPGWPRELEIDVGEALQIRNSEGRVIARVQKNIDGSIITPTPNGTDSTAIAGFVHAQDKVFLVALHSPEKATKLSLERVDSTSQRTQRVEVFTVLPSSASALPSESAIPESPGPEVKSTPPSTSPPATLPSPDAEEVGPMDTTMPTRPELPPWSEIPESDRATLESAQATVTKVLAGIRYGLDIDGGGALTIATSRMKIREAFPAGEFVEGPSSALLRIGPSIQLYYNQKQLGVEIRYNGTPLTSATAYTPEWRAGPLQSTQEVMQSYLNEDTIRGLIEGLTHEPPIIRYRELIPEWRYLRSDKAVNKQFYHELDQRLASMPIDKDKAAQVKKLAQTVLGLHERDIYLLKTEQADTRYGKRTETATWAKLASATLVSIGEREIADAVHQQITKVIMHDTGVNREELAELVSNSKEDWLERLAELPEAKNISGVPTNIKVSGSGDDLTLEATFDGGIGSRKEFTTMDRKTIGLYGAYTLYNEALKRLKSKGSDSVVASWQTLDDLLRDDTRARK